MTSAPRLNAAQRRHLADQRAEAERLAAVGGHQLEWETTFSDSTDGGTTLIRAQDGWCARGGRNHLRAVVWADNDQILWRWMRPDDTCPG